MAILEIVGRAAELASIRRVFELRSDGPVVLLIEGVAGIGKTTLWREAVREARERSYRVLASSPAESETQLALTSVRDLLDGVFDEVEEELPAPQRRALAVALLREADEAPATAGVVAAAFLTALRALARTGPLVIAIDDTQWLDSSSAPVLEFALRRLESEPVTILLARRTERPGRLPLDLDRAVPEERIVHLCPSPLTLGALHALLFSRFELSLSRPTLRRIHELSGGNPFFALELARGLANRTLGATEPLPVPDTLRELVRDRLKALPAETQDALVAASALSRPTLALVEGALQQDAAAAFAPALAEQIVSFEGERVRFEHPLLAAAVYELADPRRRGELHRRLAGLVEDVEERGRNLALATDEPNEEVASAVEEAADAAFRRGAPAAAAELAAEARRLTPGDRFEEANRRAFAEAKHRFQAGDPAGAGALLDDLIARAPPGPARARVLSRRARIRHFKDDVSGGVELLRAALAEAGGDAEVRAEIEEGLAWGLLLMRQDLPAAAEHARSAARFAEARGDRAALAEALAAQGLTEFALGRDAAETMERALALEEATLHLRVLRHPSFAYGYWLSCSDELDRARDVFQELHLRALQHGDESALPPIHNHLALIECLAGNWATAVEHADEGYAVAVQSDQRPTQASILAKRALIEAQQGAVEEARASAERSLAIAGGDGFDVAHPEAVLGRGGETAIRALGFLELSLGSAPEALRYLGPLSTAIRSAGVREPGELRFLPDEIEALIMAGRHAQAEALLAPFEQTARRLGRPSALALASRCRGLLAAARGDSAAAVSALEAAVAQHDRAPLPFERARTELVLGAAQRRAKQKRKARETLDRATASFEELGARLWADRAREELARIGGRTATRDELTSTERRVAELAAEGRSNREIAAELYVSQKTVEFHLRHVYAKLGVRSRTELARRL